MSIYFQTLGVKNIPGRLWNIDETSISLDHNPPKILAHRRQQATATTAGRSPNTTLIAAASALGEVLPPYLIFKGERVTERMRKGMLLGTQFHESDIGGGRKVIFLRIL